MARAGEMWGGSAGITGECAVRGVVRCSLVAKMKIKMKQSNAAVRERGRAEPPCDAPHEEQNSATWDWDLVFICICYHWSMVHPFIPPLIHPSIHPFTTSLLT